MEGVVGSHMGGRLEPGPKLGATVATGMPYFALHTMGWRAFQDLSGAILQEVLGQTFQTFADSNDAGRDGAFYGRWSEQAARAVHHEGVPARSPFVMQCKHIARDGASLTPSMVKGELAKARALASRGLCRSYLLITNARVSGTSEGQIRQSLKEAGVELPIVLGGSWISQTIAAHRGLRMLVPRVYGLGDLSHIIDNRAYAQSAALLRYLQSDLATFVVTDAYRRAATALQNHGFVLLLGEPAAGKSVIAATLATVAADSWGCVTIRADNASEVVDHWNPEEPGQLFWVDDAFGQVRHDVALTDDWARRLPSVMTAIAGGARVVLTSRDYIYRLARPYLRTEAHPRVVENQVLVDVADLSIEERRRILYNHVRLGDQPSNFRRAIKPFLEDASNVEPFRPEMARRLGRQAFTSALSPTRASVVTFMAESTDFLVTVYGQLDRHAQAALTAVYAAGDAGLSPTMAGAQDGLIKRLGSSQADVAGALAAMDETFVRFGSTDSRVKARWFFHHPTLREGFAAYIAQRRHLVDILVVGLSDEALLSQTECGGDAVRGGLVSIPRDVFPVMAQRLAAVAVDRFDWRRRSAWSSYFMHRCSDEFLSLYADTDPKFVSRLLDFGSYLSIAAEPKVLARLHALHKLTETDRQTAVKSLSDLAIETPDADWLDAREWAQILSPEEHAQILDRVRTELIEDPYDTLENWRSNRPPFDDPDSYYEPLERALRRYRDAFATDADAVSRLDHALEETWLLRSEGDDEDRPSRPSNLVPKRLAGDTRRSARSIFDDVDA